jgi:hypothetical protein
VRGITGTFFYRFGNLAGDRFFYQKKFTPGRAKIPHNPADRPGSADPEFARTIPAAVFADRQDNLTPGTIGFFFQLAMITIGFM